MMTNKGVPGYFENYQLDGEILVVPYKKVQDISSMLSIPPLFSEGHCIVFFEDTPKNLENIAKFIDVSKEIIPWESCYLRVIPINEKVFPNVIIVIDNGNIRQIPLTPEHSFSDWINRIISKLTGLQIYEKYKRSIVWQKKSL